MKKGILSVALALCLLLPAGCGKMPQKISDETEKPESTVQAENAALNRLRRRIAEQNAMLGVAFFGYVDSESDKAAVSEFAADSGLTESYPFLAECTLIVTQGAELYALVPVDSDTAVTVYPAEISENGNYTDCKDAPVYTGKPGEAVILRCNLSEIYSNVLISVSDGAKTLEFHPMLSMKDGHVATESGCYDFTDYQTAEEELVQNAGDLLGATDEVRDALDRGMKLLCTGDTQVIGGQQCLIFALGTEHGEQFVRERLYAVSDSSIYAYSASTDSWESLSAE